MRKTIRARYRGGKIEPLEPVELAEEEEIEVTLQSRARPGEDRFAEAIGSWEGLLDCDAFIEEVYARRHVRTLPHPKL